MPCQYFDHKNKLVFVNFLNQSQFDKPMQYLNSIIVRMTNCIYRISNP